VQSMETVDSLLSASTGTQQQAAVSNSAVPSVGICSSSQAPTAATAVATAATDASLDDWPTLLSEKPVNATYSTTTPSSMQPSPIQAGKSGHQDSSSRSPLRNQPPHAHSRPQGTNPARSAHPPSVSNSNFYAMAPPVHSNSEPDHERMFVPSQAMHVVQQAVNEPVSSNRWPVLGQLSIFRQRSSQAARPNIS
jgi:hypothetical protein